MPHRNHKGMGKKKRRRKRKQKKQVHGEGVGKDILEWAGGAAGTAVGGALGGAAGGAAGGALGLLTGPGAIVASPVLAEEGAILGATAGGAAGGVGGAKLGAKIGDFFGLGEMHGNGLSARPIQARPKGTKIRRPQPKTNVLINTNGRYSTQSFGKGMQSLQKKKMMMHKNKLLRGRGGVREVRQGTFGTVSSEFGKVRF